MVFSHCGKYAHTEAQNSPAMQNPKHTESQKKTLNRVDTRIYILEYSSVHERICLSMSNPDLRKCQILHRAHDLSCVLHLLNIVRVQRIAIGTPNGNAHYLQI